MKELTRGQREPLFQLVRYQLSSKNENVFAVTGGWDSEIRLWRAQDILARIPRETLEVWGGNDYVTISERMIGGGNSASGVTTFVLRQEAMDYESFMRKPQLIRVIIILWNKLFEDIPSLVWGVIGGSASSIITVFVLKWLGVK